MNIPCEVIEDLLPLYVDEICSQESKKIVEEHLQTCEHCQKEYRKIKMPIGTEHRKVDTGKIADEANVILEKAEKDIESRKQSNKAFETNLEESEIIKRGFRKVKCRWLISLLVVALILPACGLAVMGVNQYRREGLCFTNLDETYTAMKFVKYIKTGKYEQAVDMLESHYIAVYKEMKQYQEEGPESVTEYFSFSDDSELPYIFSGKSWFVRSDYETYLNEWKQDEQNFWLFVIEEELDAFIPKETWNQVVGENYEVSQIENITVYYPFSKDTSEMIGAYELIETEWGEYYVSYWGKDYTYASAVDICFDFVVYPYEIYLQGREEMTQRIEQNYAEFLFDEADTLAMTQEEYIEYRRKQSIEALPKYSEQTDLISFSFYDAYYTNQWHIILQISERYSGDGNIYKTGLDFSIMNGKLSTVGGSYGDIIQEKYYEQTLIKCLSGIF